MPGTRNTTSVGAAHGRLGIYLNDHLAGATAGTELARRLARSAPSSLDTGTLRTLAREVAEDRAALVDVIRRLGLPVRHGKAALGWAGEKVGRLKMNGRLVRRARLSNVLELEALRLGVEGKSIMWKALRLVEQDHPSLDPDRLGELADRARNQIDLIEELRSRELQRALGSAEQETSSGRPVGTSG